MKLLLPQRTQMITRYCKKLVRLNRFIVKFYIYLTAAVDLKVDPFESIFSKINHPINRCLPKLP